MNQEADDCGASGCWVAESALVAVCTSDLSWAQVYLVSVRGGVLLAAPLGCGVQAAALVAGCFLSRDGYSSTPPSSDCFVGIFECVA